MKMKAIERKHLIFVLFFLLFAGQLIQIIMINRCHKISEHVESPPLNLTDCTTGTKHGQRGDPSSMAVLRARTIEALSYDHSATTECLAEPLKPQYTGGIISNPEFNHGLRPWSVWGNGKMERKTSHKGNKFVVVHSRQQTYDSVSQKIYLRKGKLYTLSAWIQVSEGKAPVTAVVKTGKSFIHAGGIVAESGCWSMLKGGLSVKSTGPADIYFESENTTVEILVDSVSLQPFTKEEWRAHQEQSTEKARKSKVRLQSIDAQGNRLAGANLSLRQNAVDFPIGSAINQIILSNPAYQNWFTSRFTVTTFEDEMKWYSTERSRGKEDYSAADALLRFTQQHSIAVRGHNVFWDDPSMQPYWVKSLPANELKAATQKRINSVISKYAGKVIAWDVVNENMHFSFFEDKLGKNFSCDMYKRARQLDPNATLFLNDFNTLEETEDGKVKPIVCFQKLRELQNVTGPIAIGLESHFKNPNIAYIRSALDLLAIARVPIWITELDVQNSPENQAKYLEDILREVYSHPAVHGIILWTSWHPEGCYRMCLTDKNFKNLKTGDILDKLMKQWKQGQVVATTDDNGFFEALLFHGDYQVTVTHPTTNSSLLHNFKVGQTVETSEETTHYLQFSV